MLFRKKPVVIEAYQFQNKVGKDDRPKWMLEAVRMGVVQFRPNGDAPPYLEIQTLEGVMRANFGDWIIKGVLGEIYPCKPEIFEQTYEPVESTP